MNREQFTCNDCGKVMEHIHFGKPGKYGFKDYRPPLCPSCWQKEVKILGWNCDVKASREAAFRQQGPCYCFDEVLEI